MKRFMLVGSAALLIMTLSHLAFGQFLLSPQAGEVYKEYSLVNNTGDNSWRVTDPNATFNSNPPGNNPSDFLPNPIRSFSNVDLAGAVRAELIIDMWGGHLGTTPKQVHFMNAGADTSYITIPEITTVPDPVHGQCYMHQSNLTATIPLGALVDGTNLVQANAGPQDAICGQNFNWGQWGWYGAVLRVYYDPSSKPHPTGSITSPSTGGSFGENPTVTATASGSAGIASVDFLGYYTSYDVDGDGRLTDWQHNYHRGGGDSQMLIKGHIGTATNPPYQATWNTDWVPDQAAGSIKLQARIRDNNGVYYVTSEVSNLTLSRTNLSVKLYTVFNLPGGFWVRSSGSVGVNFNINEDLSNASGARVFVTTWNGANCDGGVHNTNINNNYTLPSYGDCNFWSFDQFDFPPSALVPGQNAITVYVESQHHGIEVMVPGPAVMVRYSVLAAGITGQPADQTVNAGQTASFSVTATGTPTLAYQWTKNDVNVSGATNNSYTTPATTGNDNGASFRCVVSNAYGTVTSNPALLTVNGGVSTVSGPWWNTQWHYRLPVAANAGGFSRTNKVANFAVNFTDLLTSLGASGALNDQAVRVVEVNGSGVVIDSNVVYQFDHDPNYNATTNASGTVAVMMAGTTTSSATRYFHIYFDKGTGFTLPTFSNQLTLTDNVFFAGQSSYQVTNQLGTLWYHKVGGGFAGMRDLNNVEWIGFDPTVGSHGAGEYRGIPNMGSYGHPGYSNGSSTILSVGPIKATIKTVTTDGTNASWIWEFYPTYQTMTLQQTGVNYWLLYEGTPSGAVDQSNGFLKNSAGQNINLGTTFAADLPSPEWAYFGKSGQSRFMFLAHHEDDNLIDHYRPFFDVGLMTVFGFGRDGSSVNHYLSQTPAHLTFGFGENESQSGQIMDNAFRDLSTGAGSAEQNTSGPAQITSQPGDQMVQAGQTATFSVTAVGSPTLTYRWQRDTVDIGGATLSSYTTAATTLPDSGAHFRCIVNNSLGTVTSNAALLSVIPGPPPPSSSIKSDEFNQGFVDLGVWVFSDPVGNSTRNVSGTQLSIGVPAGSSHDMYTNDNKSPRLVQPITNITSFDVEAKFDAPMSQQYQLEGIVVQQDATNLLRFDFYTDGTNTYVDAFSITSNVATNRVNSIIGGTSLGPLYMRLNRSDDAWTLTYSLNGSDWLAGGNFTQALVASSIGPFAGNAGGSPPAFTGLVDYFRNMNPAPVQLASFNGTVNAQHQVTLSWMTVTETNNYGFEVQKSTGTPSNYQTVPNSFIAGHGTTLEPHRYSFVDVVGGSGMLYYRLRQTDLDGAVHFSEPVQINTLTGVNGRPAPKEFALTQNYPNPFNPATKIEYTLPKETNVRLDVYNIVGQKVATLVDQRQGIGYYAVSFDATNLGSGIYIYKLSTTETSFTKKMMLVR